ncbi:DUF6327 family protein [Flavobacterium sp. K5-23]|uniref:DUF6327 family protein n=1 Tax=Flavobacterium sp. K5-23 TaxID=2746225 RepID=UPI00200DC99D|nr:DUF6327 family protein [Flavobacterium sp. K5-23]UQD55586.1 hypothetical protein FLAK523_03930 [Flavobacterium sp. K5-23]
MKNKQYTSFDQIDRELEILRIEKEINHQKLLLVVQKTKESLQLLNMVSGLVGTISAPFSNAYTGILKMGIPLIIKFLRRKKRGC